LRIWLNIHKTVYRSSNVLLKCVSVDSSETVRSVLKFC